MDMTIDQQVALDEALVPHACRLRIKRSNFRLLSDISSKESTLQLVYDVLRQTPFFKAFLVEHKDTKKSNEMYYPRNFEAYKEHYAVATRATPPKTKASVQKTKSSSDTTVTPPPTVVAGTRLFTSAKGKQPATTSKAKRGDAEDDQEEGSDDEQASNEEGEEFIHPSLSTHDEEETRDEEIFDPIPKTHENTDDEGNGIESMFETSSQMDVQPQTIVAPLPMSAPTLTPSTIATITTVQQVPTPLTTAPSTLLQDLPNFSLLFGFDNRLKTLEANFSEFMQTNQFAGAVSSIPRIIQRYMDQRMNEAVKVAIQIQFDRLCNEVQAGNDKFLKTIDENMHKIIKEQVKEHVKVQVFKILPKIKQTVNEQLEAKVLTRSSNSSKTSYAVAVDLFKIELKKILIEKIEGNKYIYQSNEQRNIYKALVEAYESDKIILDIYGDTFTLKRRCDDDEDKDEEPFVGSDRGSTRRREGKEPESASAPKEKATRSAGKSTQGSKSQQTSASEFATAEEPMQTPHEMEEPSHLEFETSADDQPIEEPSQHPEWFSQQNKPPTPDRD
nr:hypothetical protein [Tanacetum cinerariifolium]